MSLKRRDGSGHLTMPSNIPKMKRRKMRKGGPRTLKHYAKRKLMRLKDSLITAPMILVSAARGHGLHRQHHQCLKFRKEGHRVVRRATWERTLLQPMSRTNKVLPARI